MYVSIYVFMLSYVCFVVACMPHVAYVVSERMYVCVYVYLFIMQDVCPPEDGDLAKKKILAYVYQVIVVRYAVLRQDLPRIYHVYLSNRVISLCSLHDIPSKYIQTSNYLMTLVR